MTKIIYIKKHNAMIKKIVFLLHLFLPITTLYTRENGNHVLHFFKNHSLGIKITGGAFTAALIAVTVYKKYKKLHAEKALKQFRLKNDPLLFPTEKLVPLDELFDRNRRINIVDKEAEFNTTILVARKIIDSFVNGGAKNIIQTLFPTHLKKFQNDFNRDQFPLIALNYLANFKNQKDAIKTLKNEKDIYGARENALFLIPINDYFYARIGCKTIFIYKKSGDTFKLYDDKDFFNFFVEINQENSKKINFYIGKDTKNILQSNFHSSSEISKKLDTQKIVFYSVESDFDFQSLTNNLNIEDTLNSKPNSPLLPYLAQKIQLDNFKKLNPEIIGTIPLFRFEDGTYSYERTIVKNRDAKDKAPHYIPIKNISEAFAPDAQIRIIT